MVMAGSESGSGLTATDEALSSRLQWLRQRREALQEKLAQKNSELKTLCIEEAELTGVLPPEIPLEPGESPPNFRKRASTNVNYCQNLINKLKTNGVEESALELERQVQMNIAESALAVLNDATENKAVRRKHRSIYQQSQRRLQELNAQLNFLRQSHGSTLRHTQSAHIPLHSSQPHLQPIPKHRTKKPRPPLDSSGKDLSPKVESRGFLQETGVSLSPLAPEHNYNSYYNHDFQDLAGHTYPQSGISVNQNRATYHAPSPVERNNAKFSEQDFNVNNNVYVAPEHFRNRTYSQGGNSNTSISPHPPYPAERHNRPVVPNTYTEEERQQIRLRNQMKLKKQQSEEIMHHHQYPDPRYLDNEMHRRSHLSYHEADNVPRYESQMHDFSVPYHHAKTQPPPVIRARDSVDNATIGPEIKSNKPAVDAYMPPGYWMRLDDEIVWCPEDQASDRFGSLDRRKQHVAHHPSNPEMQSRYHTVSISGKSAPIPHARQYPPKPPPVHSPDSVNPPPPNRILLRTQSLGSVETWQAPSSHDGNSSVEGGRESADGSLIHANDKLKLEKEWYETSLDSGPQPRPAVRRASQHNSPIGPPLKDRAPVRSNSIPSNRRIREHHSLQQQQVQQVLPAQQQVEEQQAQRPPIPQSRYVESRVLEIPAESKPSPGSQENGNEPIIPMNSPTNHTVVQPGKYQPYREVTKPFEMSDFYKYSTKFRKRVEANTPNEQQQQHQPIAANLNTQSDQNQPNNSMPRIHQPVQRNNCPPYTLR